MSMMCWLWAVSPGQMAAFRARPDLASDFAEISSQELMDARREASLRHLPPQVRERYEASRRDLVAANPQIAEQQAHMAAVRPTLAKLGRVEPPLELAKLWNILHYLFTGHAEAAMSPADILLTGEPLGRDGGYGPPRLQGASETRAFRDFLEPLDASRLVARMDLAKMAQLGIYPLSREPQGKDAQSWRDEVATEFPRLKAYVRRAAGRGEGLLIWLT